MKYNKTFPDCYFVQDRPFGCVVSLYYEFYKFEDLPTLEYFPTRQKFEYVKLSRLKTSIEDKEVSIDHWVDKVLYRAPNEGWWHDLETDKKVVVHRLIEDIRNHFNQKQMHKMAKDIYEANTATKV